LIFADFKSIFNDLNSFKTLNQSDCQNCQEVLNRLLDFIDNNGNDKTRFGKIDHVAIKLVTKSRSYSSIIEEIENFGNKKFNAETKTSCSALIVESSQLEIAQKPSQIFFSFSK
jgi:hypothetical protein